MIPDFQVLAGMFSLLRASLLSSVSPPTPGPRSATHFAELDFHEDLVLPSNATLGTPGILGPVGTRGAGR